jgi:hypothetical protein
MSEEVKETTEEKGTSMYVHQVEYPTLLAILHKVTDVNKVFTYSMPKKAESYATSGFDLITTLNDYIDGEEDWRINKESNVALRVENETITVGNFVIKGIKLGLCIPRINSIIIIPDENCTINGAKDPTKIIQLTNCISVTPLLVRLLDEKVDGEEEKFQLGMTYEIIVPKEKNEPTE